MTLNLNDAGLSVSVFATPTHWAVPSLVNGSKRIRIDDAPDSARGPSTREFSADIVRKIDVACNDPESQDEDEAGPTEHAVRKAKTLIERVVPLRSGFHISARVTTVNGTVRITWETPNRNIRLVCGPSEATHSYIYWEVLAGSHSVQHGTVPATVKELDKRLRWLRRTSV